MPAPLAASARSSLTQRRPSTMSHDNQLETAAAAWKRLARENTSQTSSSELLFASPSYHRSSAISLVMFSLTDSGNRSTPGAPVPALVLLGRCNGGNDGNSIPASTFIRSLTACSGSLTAIGRIIPAPPAARGDCTDVSGDIDDILKSTARSDMCSTECTLSAKQTNAPQCATHTAFKGSRTLPLYRHILWTFPGQFPFLHSATQGIRCCSIYSVSIKTKPTTF